MRLATVTLAQSQILTRVGWTVLVDDQGGAVSLTVREEAFEAQSFAPSEPAGLAAICERARAAMRAGLVPAERRA